MHNFIILFFVFNIGLVKAEYITVFYYNWPENLQGSINFNIDYQSQTVDFSLSGSGDFLTSAHTQGLAIQLHNINLNNNKLSNNLTDTLAKINAQPPVLIIDQQGKLINIEQLDIIKTALSEEINHLLEKENNASLNLLLKPLIQIGLTEKQLLVWSQSFWSTLVAQWVNTVFELKQEYLVEAKDITQKFKQYKDRGIYSYLEDIACVAHNPIYYCAHLHLDYKTYASKLSLNPFANKKNPLTMHYILDLITQSQTLLPYSLKIQETHYKHKQETAINTIAIEFNYKR